MSADERSFLDAIFDNPDDDAPRLMYADWLTERGNPRGEFIRTQIELESMDEDDWRRADLEARVRELQQAHQRDWLGPLADVASQFIFRRGVLHGLRVSAGMFVAKPELMWSCGPLRHVRFHEAGTFTRELVRSRRLQSVQHLDLRDNGIGGFNLGEWLGTPNLAGLQTLDLSRNPVGVDGAELLARAWPAEWNVSALHLNGAGLGPRGAHYLAQVRFRHAPEHTCPITTVHLANNQLGLEGIRELFGWIGSSLTNVNLSQNAIGVGGGQALRSIARWTTWPLEHLDFSNNDLGPGGAEALATCYYLTPKLKRLSLNQNGIGDEGVVMLAEACSVRWQRMLRLDVAGNSITADGLRPLVETPALNRLEAIDLAGNEIGTLGVEALAASPRMAQMRHLNLSRNRIGPAGVETLVASPAAANLKRLDLSNNGIGPRGARALLESPYLDTIARLNVSKNRLGEDDIARLRERFGARVTV